MMKKLILMILIITLVALPAACGDKPDVSEAETATASAGSGLEQASPGEKESAAPATKPAPKVFDIEELLSAAEASSLVGQPVVVSFDAAAVSETGETWGSYTYDLPHEGIDVKDTIFASMRLVQNGLISPSELKKGHDAKWAFEGFKKAMSGKTAELAGLGSNAFYITDNSEVHVLFQDYYIIVAFVKDDLEASLALNKSIAEFVIGKISLDDVSLTSP